MKWSNENITSVTPFQYITSLLFGKLSLLAEIVKVRITVLVSFTTALGYFLGTDKISFEFLYPVTGIFLLACGSAALNMYQERATDALMERTKNRPIPSGRIKASGVLMISIALLLLGSAVLISKTNLIALSIGLLTFFWYNGVYTLLKKKIALAIIPGSIVGALPPLAGWAAAGGDIFDIKILYIALYFFVWQIPHFWLLLLIHGEDFSRGGFPVLTEKLNKKAIVAITFFMLVFTVLISVAIPLFNIINYNFTYILLLMFAAFMIYSAHRFFISDLTRKNILKAFIGINIFTLFFIILLIVDRMFFLMLIR
jgi:heme o synthase